MREKEATRVREEAEKMRLTGDVWGDDKASKGQDIFNLGSVGDTESVDAILETEMGRKTESNSRRGSPKKKMSAKGIIKFKID